MNTITKLSEKINQAQALDFGTIFSESIELFKKTILQGFLMQVFILIIMIPLIIVFYIPFFGLIIAQQETGYNDTELFDNFFASMSVLYILIVIVGVFVLSAISLALNAGFYRIMKKLDYNEQVTTSDFFYFFKGKYLIKTFLLMVVTIIIAIPAALLCYIPLIYAIVPLSYFVLIFAFNPELSVGDIVNVSFKLGNKKWLLSFGLFVVAYLCVIVLTLVTCGLGSLFLSPFMYHPMYLIYKNVVGFNENNVIENFEKHVE